MDRRSAVPAPDSRTPAVPGGADGSRALARECEVFVRYLLGREVRPYVVDRYVAAHRFRGELEPPSGGFDALLVSLARGGPRRAWLADCYARLWAPGSHLRRKLVLLLAVLECAPPTARELGSETGEHPARVALRLVVRGLAFVGGAVLASLLLLPARAAHRLRGSPGRRGSGAPEGDPWPR